MATKLVSSAIASHRVVLFIKTTCPSVSDLCSPPFTHCVRYCRKAMQTLASLNINHEPVDVHAQEASASEIQDELLRRTGQRTVPSVWINGEFVGGNSGSLSLPHIMRELIAVQICKKSSIRASCTSASQTRASPLLALSFNELTPLDAS